MNPQIQRTIALIKKSYDQPIIFHMLYSHLLHLLEKAGPLCKGQDDWAQILTCACAGSRLPNQGMETKLVALIKRLRPPFRDGGDRLRLMVICCYLLNRPVSLINHILLFELVLNCMGASDYLDGLILSILGRLLTAQVFGLQENRKVRPEAVHKMLGTVSSRRLSMENRVKALVCFVGSDARPPSLELLDVQPTFFGCKCLEYIGLYVKYAASTEHIGDVIPNHPALLAGLEQYMKCEFRFESAALPGPGACLVDSRAIFESLREAFDAAADKRRFIDEVTEFIAGLNNSTF